MPSTFPTPVPLTTATLPNTDFRRETALPFLSSLNAASVDLVLTDPPYLISRKSGFSHVVKGEKRLGVSMDFGDWDTEAAFDMNDLAEAVGEMARVLRPGGTAIVFFDLWKMQSLMEILTKAGFHKLRMIEWVKTNPVPLNSQVAYLSNAREMAICAEKKGGGGIFDSSYDDGMYFQPICSDCGRFHKTQKPVSLMRQLIAKHSRPGDLVVDPFSGSGTTGVAALIEGRRFAGCEPDPKFFPPARDRILQSGQMRVETLTEIREKDARNMRSYAERKIRSLTPAASAPVPPAVASAPVKSSRKAAKSAVNPVLAAAGAGMPIRAVRAGRPVDRWRTRRDRARQGEVEEDGVADPAPSLDATGAPVEAHRNDGKRRTRLLPPSGDGHARQGRHPNAGARVEARGPAPRRRALPLASLRGARFRDPHSEDMSRAEGRRERRSRLRLISMKRVARPRPRWSDSTEAQERRHHCGAHRKVRPSPRIPAVARR